MDTNPLPDTPQEGLDTEASEGSRTQAAQRRVDFNRADMMALQYLPASEEAWHLTEALTQAVEAWEKRTGQRKNGRSLEKREDLKTIVGRVSADLLLTEYRMPGNHLYRPMGKDAFVGNKSPVGYRPFHHVFNALKEIGYISVGASHFYDREWHHGRSDRIIASSEFFALASSHGVDPQGANTFFERDPDLPTPPPTPLVLTAERAHRYPKEEYRKPAKKVAFKATRQTEAIAAEVRELTAFTTQFTLEGASHHGFRRVFHCGNVPGFNWNKGGRLYSPGDRSYQALSQWERSRLLIGGKPVVELDVKASYLTILLAFLGAPLDPDRDCDPYAVEGLPRPLVKAWIAAATGLGRPLIRWPQRASEALKDKEGIDVRQSRAYSAPNVGKAIMERHPVLAEWSGEEVSWPELMYLESEGIIRTMLALKREHGVPSLPVHDSLILPEEAMETGTAVLKREYERATGAMPIVAVGKGVSEAEAAEG